MKTVLFWSVMLLAGVAQADSLRVRSVGEYRYDPAGSFAVALDSTRSLTFLGTDTFALVLDVSDPTFPRKLSRIEAGDHIRGLCYQDSYLFVASRGGLYVISVADPTRPAQVGFCAMHDSTFGVAVSGGYAYVANGDSGLRVVSVADPARPVEVGHCGTQGYATGVAADGDQVYVADDSAGLRSISVRDPTQPSEVGFCETPGSANDVFVSGDNAYVADDDSGLRVISVADPSRPVEVGSCHTSGRAKGVAVTGDYAYLASDSGGLRVIAVADPARPVEVGSCLTPDMAKYVVSRGGCAYVADMDNGLRVIATVDPARPVEVGSYSVGEARAVAVRGDHAFVASGNGGLLALSISDPGHPSELGLCDTPGYASGVAVAGDFAYVADDDSGLRVISVADPSRPVEVGHCRTPSFAWRLAVSGSHVYVVDKDSGLGIVSIADPAHPVEVGRCYTPDGGYGIAVVGDYAFVGGIGAGLRVISVADPANPVEVGHCSTPDEAYGVAASNGYVYVAVAWSGLWVYSVADPRHPVEIGHLDSLGGALDVAAMGSYVYVVSGPQSPYVRVISVADPTNPTEVGYYRRQQALQVTLDQGYAFVAAHWALKIMQFFPPGDLDIDIDSLDVAADTLRLNCPADTGHALGEFVLANTSPSYNPDTSDGPSVSPVSAIWLSGTLTGPGGTLDSVILNLPSSLEEGQTVVCTLAVHVPPELRNGDYIGSITISGRDTANLTIDETFYALLDVSRVLGDIDVDNDSLDVVADTVRVRPRLVSSGPPLEYTECALGELLLTNTSPAYNPDTSDGPSLSPLDSLRCSGWLVGPGGSIDSVLVPNLPASLAQGQTVVCTLAVYLPPGLRDGDYSGPVIITGYDSLHCETAETVYALVTKLGDLDIDDDSLDVVHDTIDLHTQPVGPVYHPYAKARFMLVNTSSSYNPDAGDGPSQSTLRQVEVEAKVEGQNGSLDSIYVLNLPESLAPGQAVECTLALVIPVGDSVGGHAGWVAVSAFDTLGYHVRDSFFLVVRGPQPREDLDSLRVAPIPFKPNQNPEHDAIHFQGLTSGARVVVYDASGQSVWTATESGDGHLAWKAEVASGIYVYLVVAKDGQSRAGKLSVIR